MELFKLEKKKKKKLSEKVYTGKWRSLGPSLKESYISRGNLQSVKNHLLLRNFLFLMTFFQSLQQ